MPAYDGILGMDWLKSHSPMTCDWVNGVLIPHNGKEIRLAGVTSPGTTSVQAITMERVLQMGKGQ
jgi:hypothetical protein